MSRSELVLAAAMLVVATATAAAQAPPETRAAALRQEREEKQRQLAPPEPTGIERTMDLVENKIVPLLQRDGVYAALGSISTGSGFAYGAGYRDRTLVNGQGSISLWAAASLKKYWAMEARGHYPILPDGTLALEAAGRIYEYPAEEFFGIGPDSSRQALATYNLHGAASSIRVLYQPAKIFRVGTQFEHMRPHVGPGGTDDLPSVEERFDDIELPGRLAQPNYLHASTFFEVDYREPRNARKGGWYRVDFSRYADRAGGAFSFDRIDVDLRQFASILAERRVFAARMVATTTLTDGPRRVPFYLLPALGGNDTLRGFRALRFRGPHRLLMQAEYRWEIWSAFEAALFYDTGKVALRRADLNFQDLEHDYGFGFRFNTDQGVVLRVDAAFGSRDGRHLHIVAGAIF